mmetsp:Transcript_122947/g.217709  ORF Transcript_122947/g.217709 Transcript_122947/m.217709 type:complete len:358 (+) Transcript_122947:81-1154(+)
MKRMKWPLRTEETHLGQGPLKAAIELGGVKEVMALAESGAPFLAEFHLDEVGKETGNAFDLVMLHKRYGLALQLLALESPPGAELAKGCRRALAWAARDGRLPILQQLVVHGADVKQQDEQGRSALFLAAMRGHAPCVQLLLDADAMASEKDAAEVRKWSVHWKMQNQLTDVPQDSAAPRKQVKNKQEDLSAVATDVVSAETTLQVQMYLAITLRGLKEVKDLILKGAPVCAMYDLDELGRDQGTALDLAISEKRYELVQYMMKEETSGCGEYLVRASVRVVAWAARDGKDNILQELLRLGADANQCDEKGRSALHLAALRGQKDCVRTLLKAGVWEKESQQDAVRDLAAQWKIDLP